MCIIFSIYNYQPPALFSAVYFPLSFQCNFLKCNSYHIPHGITTLLNFHQPQDKAQILQPDARSPLSVEQEQSSLTLFHLFTQQIFIITGQYSRHQGYLKEKTGKVWKRIGSRSQRKQRHIHTHRVVSSMWRIKIEWHNWDELDGCFVMKLRIGKESSRRWLLIWHLDRGSQRSWAEDS